jgi:hypothetical protein
LKGDCDGKECIGIYAGLALLAGTALTAHPAMADVKVLQSNVPDIRKGTVLKDDDILDVPDNKTVKVLLLPSKVTKKIAGPYKGTAQDYAPSTMPTVQVKPSEQLDTGTTLSSPPPIDAPWLKEEAPEQ